MFLYYSARVLLMLSRVMPNKMLFFAVDRLMIAYYWLDKKRRNITINNMRKAYRDKDEQEIVDMSITSYKELGKTAAECLLVINDKLDPNSVVTNKDEALAKIEKISADAPNGVIYITAHYSNWELLCHFFGQNGMPLLGVVKESKNRKIEQNISTPFREKFGNKSVGHKKSMISIAKALKSKKRVLLAVDQWMSPPNGVKVEFFGNETYAVRSVAVLKKKLDPLVVPVFIVREGYSFKVVIGDPIEFVGRDEDMTQRYYSVIENQIRVSPEQWMWVHDRWKYQLECKR